MSPLQRRLLMFVYGNKNLVGCLLALGALGAYFLGVIHNWWIEIILGCYAIGYLAAPQGGDLETALSGHMDPAEIAPALDKLSRDIKPRVPAEVFALVDSISQSILSIVPALGKAQNVADPNLFTIRQTVFEYLPQTLQNYVTLPPAFRSTYPVQGGKTATQLLIDQLQLLDGKMKEVVNNLLTNNTQALIANGNFLRDKFKTEDFLTPV